MEIEYISSCSKAQVFGLRIDCRLVLSIVIDLILQYGCQYLSSNCLTPRLNHNTFKLTFVKSIREIYITVICK